MASRRRLNTLCSRLAATLCLPDLPQVRRRVNSDMVGENRLYSNEAEPHLPFAADPAPRLPFASGLAKGFYPYGIWTDWCLFCMTGGEEAAFDRARCVIADTAARDGFGRRTRPVAANRPCVRRRGAALRRRRRGLRAFCCPKRASAEAVREGIPNRDGRRIA